MDSNSTSYLQEKKAREGAAIRRLEMDPFDVEVYPTPYTLDPMTSTLHPTL